jgi:hypothetical protein
MHRRALETKRAHARGVDDFQHRVRELLLCTQVAGDRLGPTMDLLVFYRERSAAGA